AVPASLGFLHDVFGYLPPTYQNVGKEPPRVLIKVPLSGEVPAVTLSLGRGLAVRGVIRDRDGKPAAGAVVLGQNEEHPCRKSSAVTNSEGRVELTGLSPYTRTILTAGRGSHAAPSRTKTTPTHPLAR